MDLGKATWKAEHRLDGHDLLGAQLRRHERQEPAAGAQVQHPAALARQRQRLEVEVVARQVVEHHVLVLRVEEGLPPHSPRARHEAQEERHEAWRLALD